MEHPSRTRRARRRALTLGLGAAALLVGVPGAVAATTLTPSVVTSTAPAAMPTALSATGNAIPPGATVLALTFSTQPASGDGYSVSCPANTAPTSWSNDTSLMSANPATGRATFSILDFGAGASQSLFVLCQPVAKSTSKLLPKSARSPATFVAPGGVTAIAQGAKPKKGITTIRFARATVTGLQPNVPSVVTSPCGKAYSLYLATAPSGFTASVGPQLIVTATGTATTATIPIACQSFGN